MIKTPLFQKFGSNVIFQINKVREANKSPKGEIEQKEELTKQGNQLDEPYQVVSEQSKRSPHFCKPNTSLGELGVS